MKESNAVRVLIVSANEKLTQFFKDCLPPSRFEAVLSARTAGEARRMLVDQAVDLVFINTPLSDDFGTQFASEISENPDLGIMLFVRAEVFDAVCPKAERYGILTLPKPLNRQFLFQSISLLLATRQKIRRLEEKAISLEHRMEEIRLINRAKMLLMERLGMNEAEAHRHIEKQAMDRCVKRIEIARRIVAEYDHR